MATLSEIRGVFGDAVLRGRVGTALIIAVQAVLDGTPTADDMRYAAHVFSNPEAEAAKAVMSVLAKNHTATISQILAASDSAIQTNVDDVIAVLSAAWVASQA
jgi:hypothetical protein